MALPLAPARIRPVLRRLVVPGGYGHEEAPDNLVPHPSFEGGDAAGWSESGTSTTTFPATTAQALPGAGAYSGLLTATGGAGTHIRNQTFAGGAAGTRYQLDCAVLAGGTAYFEFGDAGDGAYHLYTYQLTGAGVLVGAGHGGTVLWSTITPLGSGWYRVAIAFQRTASGTFQVYCVPMSAPSGAESYTPAGTPESVYVDDIHLFQL